MEPRYARLRFVEPGRLRNARALIALIACGICVFASLLFLDAALAQDAAEKIWPTQEWAVSTPEDQGMSSADLAKLVAFGTTRSLDSLLIARHGRIVLDVYYAPYTSDIPHAMNSATKAVIGSLIAIAHKDGLLDRLDHPMLDFFAGRNVASTDERKRAITVQHLLNMTSGLEWEEGIDGGREQSLADLGRSPDWTQFILDRPMVHQPGDIFYYNSGGTDLLSAIITRLTGKPAIDYAQEKLFTPLGIKPPFWRRDPQGLSMGATGLSLRPRDIAKIGYLYLRHGEWAGQRVLPPEWVDAVSRATISMNAAFEPGLRYSNLFWALPEKHMYMAVGYHCQVIMVLPHADIVAVTTARDFCPFGKLADLISGAVKSDSALPANDADADLLAKAISNVSTEKASEVGATSPLTPVISGKTYNFPDSPLTIKSLALFLTEAAPRYLAEFYIHGPTDSSITLDGPIGLDGLYRKSKPVSFGVQAVKGTWLNDRTFAIDFQFLGPGEQRHWVLRFDGDKVILTGKGKDGHEVSVVSTTAG